MSLLVQAASYLGNYALSSIVYFKFSVTDATGVLTTLGGTPVVKVYKDNGTTESTAGVTLTVDFDSRTGLCQVAVDTSSDGTFYSAGSEFEAVLTAGTVGVVSVAGTPVGHFSLLNRVDTLADGVTHGGTTAMLRLGSSTSTPALYVTSSGGDAVKFACTGAGVFGAGLYVTTASFRAALLVTATGSNSAAVFQSTNASAAGIEVDGGGEAVHLEAGSGSALVCLGADNGAGIFAQGSGTYPGMRLQGQVSGGSGPGLEVYGAGGGAPGIQSYGGGTNHGIVSTGGTNGDGLRLAAAGTGHDVKLAGSGDMAGKLAADALDNVLVESSILAGAGLTDDSGTQLTTLNLRQALALIASAVDGVLAGAAGTSITTKPAGKPTGNYRVTATVDASGNRSALTLKVPT